MFNPNPAFLLVQKLKSAPKGLRDPKYTLTSSARRWFRLSFCTPISALHSPAKGGFIFIFIAYTNSKRVKN